MLQWFGRINALSTECINVIITLVSVYFIINFSKKIVYIFFMDEKIHVLTVTNIGMKIWGNGGMETHDVYNW